MKYLARAFPFLAFAIAACGGQSCSCLQPIPGGFPTDSRRHDDAIQLRVSQTGLDYLNANGKALAGAFLPMGSTFDVPASCGGSNEVCCLNGQPQMCAMNVDVQSVNLTPQPPDTLVAQIRTGLKSQAPIPITINQVITAKCYFAIDTSKYTQAPYVEIDPTIQFSVDQTTHLTSLGVTTAVKNLDQSMLDITPQSGFGNTIACGAANISFIKTFIISQLTKTLQDQISQSVEGSLCAKCMTQADCDSFADACTGGSCMRGGKCLQEVGVAGKLDVGALLASLSSGAKAGMDTLAVLGGYAEVTSPSNASGISLGMIGGGQGDPHNTCVPVRPAPMVPTVDKWMEETAQTEPQNGKPFHVGIGIHESHLNTMAWAAFDSGALCLHVGTPTVAQLDSKTLGVLMPSLNDLTHDADAPLFLVLRPAQEPQITLGAGTFTVDMNGNKTIADPLLHITIPKMSIDFYAFVDDRYVRIMTLTGDIALPVSLDVDGMGQIVPLIGDLTKAFSNVTVTNSELLAEDPAKLAKAFPMLLGLAAGQLGSVLKPIALPQVMGINLQIVAIEPTDNQTFLSIFADLALQSAQAFHAETQAYASRVLAPPTAAFRIDGGMDAIVQPRVELAVSGAGPDGADGTLEYQVSFDDGFSWTPWGRGPTLSVTHPTLWLQGRHHVLVRSRVVDQPSTTDPTPTRVDFLVDTIAPIGVVAVDGDDLVLTGKDLVSPPEKIEWRWVEHGVQTPWRANVARIPSAGVDAATIQLRDEAGNVGEADFHGRTTTASTGGCSCATDGAAPSGRRATIFALLLGAALLLVRRRRLAGLLALAIGVGLFATGCGEDAGGPTIAKGDQLDPSDEIGRFSDTIAQNGYLHVSAYDDTWGDLAYATIDETKLDQPIIWQWVDGLPAADPSAMVDPNAYRRGSIDAGDDVGLYTSLALTSGGDPRIAYFDRTNGQLKLASATSSERKWTSVVVEKPAAGKGGYYASISLDKNDVPSIAYAVTGIPDGKGGFVGRLRLATAKSASPTGPGDFTVADLDEAPIPCAGLCAKSEACLWNDPMDHTKGSACHAVDANPCPMMCGTGQACVSAMCVDYLPPVKAPDLIEGTGLFAQLRRTKSGARAVVYYDHEQGDLKLALESGGTFTKAFIDGNDPTTDVGQFATAQVGPDDAIHVAYVDAISDRLLYKRVQGGMAPMTAEVVDDGMRMDGPHPVGGGASLWTDGNQVRVVYQEQTAVDLWQAVRNGGTWSTQSLKSGAAGYGFYPHVVSDGGKLYLTQFAYDRTATQVGVFLAAALQ